MNSKLIIDGNSVYEIDEDCMMKKDEEERKRIRNNRSKGNKNDTKRKIR